MTSNYFGSGCDCTDCMPTKKGLEEVRRCGFCGRYFRGVDYLSDDEVNAVLHTADVLNGEEVPLGYCPEALRECEEQDMGTKR